MTDTLDSDTRSRVMAQVRSQDTGLEKRFRHLLDEAGISGYECNPRTVPGCPDLVFSRAKVAVFVDSCFWHGCPRHVRRPGSNSEYWQQKIDRNVARDRRVRAQLRRAGWSVLTVWEHEMRRSPCNPVRRLARKLEARA